MVLDPSAFRSLALATPPLHDGKPGFAQSRFLVPADPVIGTVTSASTNQLTTGFAPMTRSEKMARGVGAFLVALLGGILGAAAMAAFVDNGAPFDLPEPLFVALGGVVGALGPGALLLFLAQRRPRCEYVGTEGLERYVRGWFGVKHQRLVFAQAAGLRISRIRQYYNGVYTGTIFGFTWTDARGGKLFHLGGSYHDGRPIESTSLMAFAQAAEDAWTGHRLRRLEQTMATEGLAWFRVGARDAIGVGMGVLFLRIGGVDETLRAEQIEGMAVRQGVLAIRRVGAKDGILGIGSKGITTLNTATIDDLNVLAVAFARYVGVALR